MASSRRVAQANGKTGKENKSKLVLFLSTLQTKLIPSQHRPEGFFLSVQGGNECVASHALSRPFLLLLPLLAWLQTAAVQPKMLLI